MAGIELVPNKYLWNIWQQMKLLQIHGYFFFIGRLLVFGIAVFPLVVEKILYAILFQKSDWEFKPELYFLSPGQPPEDPRTSLLIINNTGEEKHKTLIQN